MQVPAAGRQAVRLQTEPGFRRRSPDSRDLTRQDWSGDRYHRTYTANLTWQMSERNKANFFYHLGDRWLDNDSSPTQTPEATSYRSRSRTTWRRSTGRNPLTSRFLLRAVSTSSTSFGWWNQPPDSGIPTGFQPNAIIPKFEVGERHALRIELNRHPAV